jgi:hypothetical protein
MTVEMWKILSPGQDSLGCSCKKKRAEESERPLSCELVLEVALPPVNRVHLVQDRAYLERIAARVRDPVAGLPMEGSHES